MTIAISTTENQATITLEGRLDTLSSPQLEEELKKIPETATTLTFDLAKIDYVSSAGLRVFLGEQKRLKALGGNMVVTNICPAVKEVFDITGLSDILTCT